MGGWVVRWCGGLTRRELHFLGALALNLDLPETARERHSDEQMNHNPSSTVHVHSASCHLRSISSFFCLCPKPWKVGPEGVGGLKGLGPEGVGCPKGILLVFEAPGRSNVHVWSSRVVV